MEWFETGVGYDIALWFNSVGEGWLNTFLKIFDITGGESFYIFVFPLIFWCINKSLGKRLIIVTLLSSYLNLILKNIWLRPRPYDVTVPGKDQVVNRLPPRESYGLPSGHTMGSTSFWGYLYHISKKKSAKITCIAIVFLTGISRMVHGMHFIQDVVVGFTVGLIVLILFIAFEPKITALCNQEYNLLQRILLVFFSTGAALLLVVLLGFQHLDDVSTIVGGFFGAMVGIVLEKEFLNFNVDGGLKVRLARYILGFLAVAAVYIGLKFIFNLLGWENNYFRFIRYSLLAFVITYPVPKLFVFLKLAERSAK